MVQIGNRLQRIRTGLATPPPMRVNQLAPSCRQQPSLGVGGGPMFGPISKGCGKCLGERVLCRGYVAAPRRQKCHQLSVAAPRGCLRRIMRPLVLIQLVVIQ